MTLKEVEVSTLTWQPLGERPKVNFADNLQDRSDFEQLKRVNPSYINFCAYQKDNNWTFFFGDAVKHDIWRALLEKEIVATIYDRYHPGQLWIGEEESIRKVDMALGLGIYDDDKKERRVLREFFKLINPEFLEKPFVSVSYGLTSSYDVFKYFPTLKRLVKI